MQQHHYFLITITPLNGIFHFWQGQLLLMVTNKSIYRNKSFKISLLVQ